MNQKNNNKETILMGIIILCIIILLIVSFSYGYYFCSKENCDGYLVRDKLGFKCLPKSIGEIRDGQLIVNKEGYENDLYIFNGNELNESS